MMAENASATLRSWSHFYIMTGSAAASLTGLMFVVITLITDEVRRRGDRDGISIFSTPTVAHFGAALLVSMILGIPWHLFIHPATLLGIVGLCGLLYVLRLM